MTISTAFRLGPLDDSGLVATRLWDVSYSICASPALLERYGGPEAITAERLHDLPVISTGQPWRFGGVPNFELHNMVHHIDELELAAHAVQRGLGFGYLPSDLARKAGRVVEVIGLKPAQRSMYAVYPTARLLSGRVRRLIDHMRHHGRKLRTTGDNRV